MLTFIRDKATGWIAGIIVGALTISFAFWGVNFYFGQGVDINVASVNGEDINLRTYQRSFYNLKQRMQQSSNSSAEEDELIRDRTIKNLIDTEVINQVVRDNNLQVTDAEVAETIKSLDPFKSEDGFDRTKYELSISNLGMDTAFFESQLRMDLLSEQLQAGLSESFFIIDSELDDIVRLKRQIRDITYTILEPGSYIDEIEVSDTEIEDFYEENAERYVEPEKVRIAYIDLSIDELAEAVEADEETLVQYYQDNKDQYDVEEQRSVTKLSVKFDENASDEDVAEAKKVIESAKDYVDQDLDFEAIIEKFPEEGKGALEFSEHAFMTRDVFEPEEDDFLFSSDEGTISDIIETKKGFLIMKVGEIRGGPKNVYENSAEDVEKDYRQYQAELQFFELAEQLTVLSYEHSDTLEIAAEAIEREIVETDFISRDNKLEGVPGNAEVLAASFDPELISSGGNSDVIELSDNHIAVLQVLDHEEAATKPLDEVRDEVIADIKNDKAKEKVEQTGEMILEKLNEGVAKEEISSEFNFEWSTAEKVKRDDVNVNRSVLRTAFQAGKQASEQPLISGQLMGSGDYAVVLVTAVYDDEREADIKEDTEEKAEADTETETAEAEAEDETEVATETEAEKEAEAKAKAEAEAKAKAEDEKFRKDLALKLERSRGSSEWQEFLENAKNNAEISIYEENF